MHCLPHSFHNPSVSGSGCIATSPVHPGCPSPPLLPVWTNVSSISPWLSDFRAVQFSVSPGCFLFLNCCPSFGCARRHSVSTYTSILAGYSLSLLFSCLSHVISPQFSYNFRLVLGGGQCDFHSLLRHLPSLLLSFKCNNYTVVMYNKNYLFSPGWCGSVD